MGGNQALHRAGLYQLADATTGIVGIVGNDHQPLAPGGGEPLDQAMRYADSEESADHESRPIRNHGNQIIQMPCCFHGNPWCAHIRVRLTTSRASHAELKRWAAGSTAILTVCSDNARLIDVSSTHDVIRASKTSAYILV